MRPVVLKALRVVLAALLPAAMLAPALVVSAVAQVPEGLDARIELSDRIEAARLEGDYAGAAVLAGDLLDLTLADTLAQAFETEDAERLAETLEFAAGLPNDERAKLARADSLAHVGEIMWGEGRFAEGAEVLAEELELRRESLGRDHHEVATSLNNLAAITAQQGDLPGAEVLYLEALELKRDVLGEAHPEVALSINNAASLRYAQGDYAAAESLLREAHGLLADTFGDADPMAAATLLNLAGVMRAQGKYAEAEPLFRTVLALRRELLGDDDPQVAEAMNMLAGVLKARGDYSGAEPLYRAAYALRRRRLGEAHPSTAKSLNNLAAFLYSQGSYGEAEPLFREALELRRRSLGESHPEVAQGLNNLAAVLYAQEDYAGAETLYEQALEMRRELLGEGHPSYASSLYNLGVLQKAKGDYASAMRSLRESYERRRVLLGDEHPDTATSLYNLAEVSYRIGEYARADSLYRASLGSRRLALGNEHPHVAVTLHHMGVTLKAAGDYEAAEPLLEEACVVYDAARLRAGPGISRATFLDSPYADLAEAKLALGRESEAWPAAERFLARTLTDLLTTASVRDLTETELAREESLEVRLAGCERDLSAYRRIARADTSGESETLIAQARTALLEAEAEWSAFQREMSERYPVSEGRGATLEEVQASLEDDTGIVGWIDVEVGADAYESWGYVVRSEGPVFWAHLGRSGASVDGTSGSGTGGSGTSAGATSIYESFQAFGKALADPSSTRLGIRVDAEGVWRARMVPLLPALEGADRLIVVPSGPSLGVPLEALVTDDGALLGERYAVSYVPSSTLHAWLSARGGRERRPSREGRWSRGRRSSHGSRHRGALLLGDPPFHPGHLSEMAGAGHEASGAAPEGAPSGGAYALGALPRLTGTRDEVLALAEILDDPIPLLGRDASEESLVELSTSGRLDELELLHFATHAHVDDRVPGRSALVLSQVGLTDPVEAAAAGEHICDGVLTAREIVREWDLSADLVTLSACETALGREAGGEGYIGLSHAFLRAGARSLLVSLWKVEDRATSLLMQRFYENRAGVRRVSAGEEPAAGGGTGQEGDGYPEGVSRETIEFPPMGKAEALREAKLWLREFTDGSGRNPYAHPFYWSAFVLLGDGS